MRTVGLFAGIGGFELGLERAGHRTALLCENDKGARAVLEERFPDVGCVGDIADLRSLPASAELVAAGFPCQDLSQAGSTAGLSGNKSGLVYEVFRLMRVRKPEWVVLENVPFMMRLDRGSALTAILDEFERRRYRWAYRIIDTRAFGVPQRRERLYIAATLSGDPRAVLLSDDAGEQLPGRNGHEPSYGFYWSEGNRGLGWAVDAVPTIKGGSRGHGTTPPAVLMPDGAIIVPNIRDAERLQGFPAGWTEPAATVAGAPHRWRLVGNAVTVDIAEWLGRRLDEPKAYNDKKDVVLQPSDPWPTAAWSMGGKRYCSDASKWPVARKYIPLELFLKHAGTPLTERATQGFLSRIRASSLNLPRGFKTKVAAHLRTMKSRGA